MLDIQRFKTKVGKQVAGEGKISKGKLNHQVMLAARAAQEQERVLPAALHPI